MGILDFLNNFKASTTKIGVYISPKSILEVMEFDTEQKKVLKYSYTNINYNISTRQIDMEELPKKLQSLFEELNIKKDSHVHLTIPTIHIGHQTFPSILDDESIKMALASEAERSYIFKKHEPIISWQEISTNPDAETKFLAYSAVQKEDLENLESIFEKFGAKLVTIDTSYAALIRGLSVAGLITEQVESGINWNILLITSNSYVILSLIGDKLVDVFEDPLAIKSFRQEEIYPTIAQASSANLINYPADHLLIVSESNEASAEVLSSYINPGYPVTFLDCNKYTKDPLVEWDLNVLPSKVPMISPEIIGTCVWKQTPIPLNFNFRSDNAVVEQAQRSITLFGYQFALTPQLLQYCLLGLVIIISLILTITYFIVASINGAQDKIYQDLSMQLGQLEQTIQASSDQGGAKLDDVINNVYSKNKDFLTSYDAIALDIPEKLWLEKLEIHNDLTVFIQGKSYTVEDIINYYQSLKRLSKFKDLKITMLKITGGNQQTQNLSITQPKNDNASGLPALPTVSVVPSNNGQKYYEFAFGESQVSSQTNAQGAAQPGAPQPPAPNPQTPPGAEGEPAMDAMPMGPQG